MSGEKESTFMKTKIRNSITGLLLIPQVLACLVLLPSVQAAPDPPPPPGANTRDGAGAMAHITTGQFNTAFGTNALNKLTTGNNNGAQGNSALFSNVNGNGNVAVGSVALRLNVDGDRNTAIGYGTLRSNTVDDNTAVGWLALASNTTGYGNTATGGEALSSNTGGVANTAVGNLALLDNVTGNFNTATGFRALQNSVSHSNTAFGYNAGFGITSGNSNTCVGRGAGSGVTTGSGNVLIGVSAGFGTGAGSNNIYLGTFGTFNESQTIRIGGVGQTKTFIGGITGVNQGSPTAVFINTTTGQLGTTPPASSRRYKKEIKAMDQTSEAILGLKPVTFHYKGDSTGTPQFGLIAEEVAEVNPDLIMRDENGEIYTVRYEAVNAMLLNEFLKEHRKVEQLTKDFESKLAEQQKQIEALTTGLQKVSAQLEASKTAPQMVNNP
jgi:hypothetical protein